MVFGEGGGFQLFGNGRERGEVERGSGGRCGYPAGVIARCYTIVWFPRQDYFGFANRVGGGAIASWQSW